MSALQEAGGPGTRARLDAALSAAFLGAEAGNRHGRSAAGKDRGGLLAMSSLGGCRRRATYALAGVERQPVQQEKRQAQLGTWQHAGLLPQLVAALGGEAAGVLTEQKVTAEVAGVPLLGSADLYAPAAVVDLKTVGEYGLSRVPLAGVRREHRMQTTGYALGLEAAGYEVTERAIIYLDRASGEHLVRTEEVDDSDRDEVYRYVADVAEWATSDLDAAPRDERGPGLSIVCDGCEFLARCWGPDAVPGRRGPQARLREEASGLEGALGLYADAHAREKDAAADKRFAGAMLDGLPAGTYGPWLHRTRRATSASEFDVEEAKRLLADAGIEAPYKTSPRSAYTLPPRPAQ